MAKTFILNDESKTNSYGFRVLNSGIDLERFKNNPVLLSDHWNNTSNVIGRFENIRVEGSLLKADAVFDEADEDAKKLAGKVERGFIKGCSMGIRFSHKFIEEQPDQTYVLNKAELFEVSLVAVPSNANAVKLYSESGELLDEEQITLSLANLKGDGQHERAQGTAPAANNTNKSNMSKLQLNAVTVATLMAHGLKNADLPEEVDSAVAKLSAALEAEKTAHGLEKTKREELDRKIKEQEKAQLNALLDQAVTDGQILADQKETFAALGYDQAKTIIAGLPKAKSLSAGVAPQGGGSADPKTMEEFFKLSTDQQLAFKDANPAAYQALFA